MLLSNPPDTDIEPATSMFVPESLTCTTFAEPLIETLNGPLVSTIALLVPFVIAAPADTEMLDKPPPSPVIRPVVVKFPASTFPVTFNDVRVPVDVMFGCAPVSTVPADTAYVAFATVPDTLAPATEFATTENPTSPDTFAPATEFAIAALVTSPETFAPATALAVTAKFTCPVTLGPATALALSDDTACVAFATTPETFAPVIAAKLAPSPDTYVKTPPVPDTLPADTLPVTDNADNVPTLVIFGCAAVVTVPANGVLPADTAYVAFATKPTLAPAIFDKPPPSPVNNPVFAVTDCAVTIPLTPNADNVPTDVMFG